ncbi:MAG: ABC transporter ATP-binding protein [Gammaproteobacteria bacterium]|nr:ABC transporter ATP-binding protein [Gammaproteobacteria bacterium]
MSDSIIRCENLSKTYVLGGEEVHALADVSIGLNRGDYAAVMGPSGSGKSTFMNIVGCLDTPDSGQLWIDNEEVSELSKNDLAGVRNKQIGFVFQQFNLLGRTSAMDNVALPLLYGGVTRHERRDRAQEALMRVGLKDRMDHHPTQLSGGQQQRVAIARALVNEPAILLADEPTGALDQHTGEEIMEIFDELNDAGLTILLVTHEYNIATHAQQMIRFLDGEITGVENLEEIKAA